MAIEVSGNWNIGYVMDMHSVNSVYMGDDAFGHPIFDTQYTELGTLVKQLKYRNKYDAVDEIIKKISSFVIEKFSGKIDCVIPVPPTKKRSVQPTFLLAESIAEILECAFTNDVLEKTSVEQAKNDPLSVKNSINKLLYAKRPTNILLVDDLFSTGSTAKECVRVLKEDTNVLSVSFLAITKTKG